MDIIPESPCFAVTHFPNDNPFVSTLRPLPDISMLQKLDLSKCKIILQEEIPDVKVCLILRDDPFLNDLQHTANICNMDYVYVSCGGISHGCLFPHKDNDNFILPPELELDLEDDVFEEEGESELRYIAEKVAMAVLA